MSTKSFQISFSFNQIMELVNQLSFIDKVKLGKEIAKETKDEELTRLLDRFRTDDLSQEEIDREVETVRAEMYDESTNN